MRRRMPYLAIPLLAACAPQVILDVPPPGPVDIDLATIAGPSHGPGPGPGPEPVPAARAVALFDAVCGSTLPDFRNAGGLLRANGFTRETAAETIFSTREDASFRVRSGGDDCSFVFGSTEPRATIFAAFESLGTAVQRGNEVTSPYRETGATVTYAPPQPGEGRLYYNVRLTP